MIQMPAPVLGGGHSPDTTHSFWWCVFHQVDVTHASSPFFLPLI